MDDGAKVILAIVLMILVGVACCYDRAQNEQVEKACVQKHCADGSHPEWYQPYRSRGICICPGVLEP